MQTELIYQQTVSFNSDVVRQFSIITGDLNPIHIDPVFALNTPFKKNIVHGFLAGAVFSKILGMDLPGKGSIYLFQDLNFLKPIFFDTDYLAEVKVEHIDYLTSKITLITRIYSFDRSSICIEGTAKIKNVDWVKKLLETNNGFINQK